MLNHTNQIETNLILIDLTNENLYRLLQFLPLPLPSSPPPPTASDYNDINSTMAQAVGFKETQVRFPADPTIISNSKLIKLSTS